MRIFVTPKAGQKVRDPKTMQYVADAGEWKEDSTYWRRQERDGAVTIATSEPGEASRKAKKEG